MSRRGGSFEGLLIFIAVIIGLIITILKYTWPILLAAAILFGAIYGYMKYKAKKDKEEEIRNEEISKLKNHLQMLEKCHGDAKMSLQTNPHQPFQKSLFDQSQFEIDITNAKIERLDGILSDEEAQSIIDNAQKSLDDYNLVYGDNISSGCALAFENLNRVFSLPKEFNRVNVIPTSKHIFKWNNEIISQKRSFSKKYFNKVELINSLDVFAITCKTITYYFYPDCIVESKSKYDFTVHSYENIDFQIMSASVEEEKNGLSGAKVIGTTYLHRKVDGGPDQRYSYNPRYTIYKYYYVYSRALSNFVLEIGDETFANTLYQRLTEMCGKDSSCDNDGLISYVEEVEANQENSDHEENSIATEDNDDSQIIETMHSIFEECGKGVALEKRFIFMLDDYKVFNEIPYFKNILKLIQGEEILKEIIDQDSWNTKCLSGVAMLSQKYMLQESAVERVLKDVVLAINK